MHKLLFTQVRDHVFFSLASIIAQRHNRFSTCLVVARVFQDKIGHVLRSGLVLHSISPYVVQLCEIQKQ